MSSGPAEGRARLVLGTAGHIDHGKTRLVQALTGTDCDRLPEERERGITIELGFAKLDLGSDASFECSVIDVPGHEKFVRTMVAGATGIDVVLLVVAADEGVMPQTREHVAVCDLLGVSRGVVAITKSDLVDEETCELAAAEVEDLLAETRLANSPTIAVSAENGDGIDALRAELRAALSSAVAERERPAPPRLAIDRAFAVKGFGTVVTGTLSGGALEVGEAVVIHSSVRSGGAGAERTRELTTKVRGLQTHGEATERALPGGRCAVNLQGVELDEVSRGDVLSVPDALRATASFDVEMQWVAEPPQMNPHVSVELLAGSSERRARVAPIGEGLGRSHFARVHIDDGPLPLHPGDRFVVRGFSRSGDTGATLGGGRVLDVNPPHRRRSDPELHGELARLAEGDEEVELALRIRRSGLSGTTEASLRVELGWDAERLSGALAALAHSGRVIDCGDGTWLGPDAFLRATNTIRAAVAAYHRAEPLRPGLGRAALLGELPPNVPSAAANHALDASIADGALEHEPAGGFIREAGFTPQIDAETEALLDRIRQRARDAGLEPPSVRDWAGELDISTSRFRDLSAHLERGGELVPASGGELWFDRAAIDALCDRVRAHFEANETLDTATYKELTGTTRRTTVPLMELLDDRKITRRRGDQRVAGPAARSADPSETP